MNSPTTRSVIIVLAAVIVVIAAGIFWAVSAQAAYKSDTDSFKQELAKVHTAQRDDFDNLPAQATNADVAALIQQSENRLKDILAKAPNPQPILWLPFLAADTKQQANELHSAAQELETALRNLRHYATYQTETAAIISDVTRQEYISPAGQEALAAKWSAGVKKLESLQVPQGAEQSIGQFASQFKKMQATVDAMVQATKNGDFAKYTQQSSMFSAQLGELGDASRVFTKLGRTYDEALTKAYNKLGEITK